LQLLLLLFCGIFIERSTPRGFVAAIFVMLSVNGGFLDFSKLFFVLPFERKISRQGVFTDDARLRLCGRLKIFRYAYLDYLLLLLLMMMIFSFFNLDYLCKINKRMKFFLITNSQKCLFKKIRLKIPLNQRAVIINILIEKIPHGPL
jgi:hypothetical protein